MAKIFVTKSFLPPQNEFDAYVEKIWQSGQLTNQGPLLLEFEKQASSYIGAENFHFVTNGTLALQIALRAFEIETGDILTTPFSYVATVSSILWEKYNPVFVDIDPETYCIDADKIEASITENTKAILAVHVFGFPCDVEKIQEIADKYKLKVIYDGAHSFGAEYKGRSLLSYGDASTCSFHATKLFHTIEGGAIIIKDQKASDKAELIKRFGHTGDEHYMLGINAKASEFQAAMGLCNLKYIDDIIQERKVIFDQYDNLLTDKVKKPKLTENVKHNYGYYPVLFTSETILQNVYGALKEKDIYPRRYFYPSLNTLPYIDSDQKCAISEDIASRILCIPLYAGLEKENVELIADTINQHAA